MPVRIRLDYGPGRPPDPPVALEEGDLLGRSHWCSAQVWHPSVAEIHAIVVYDPFGYRLVAVGRRPLTAFGETWDEVYLTKGLVLTLAPGVELTVEEVTPPSSILLARLGDRPPRPLAAREYSVVPSGDALELVRGVHSDAVARLFRCGSTWMVDVPPAGAPPVAFRPGRDVVLPAPRGRPIVLSAQTCHPREARTASTQLETGPVEIELHEDRVLIRNRGRVEISLVRQQAALIRALARRPSRSAPWRELLDEIEQPAQTRPRRGRSREPGVAPRKGEPRNRYDQLTGKLRGTLLQHGLNGSLFEVDGEGGARMTLDTARGDVILDGAALPPLLEGVPLPEGVRGKLFVSELPGHARSLHAHLAEWTKRRVHLVVNLADPDELRTQAGTYVTFEGRARFQLLQLPLTAGGGDLCDLPQGRETIVEALRRGKNVVVHCGLDPRSRSTLLCTAVLCALGEPAVAAVQLASAITRAPLGDLEPLLARLAPFTPA